MPWPADVIDHLAGLDAHRDLSALRMRRVQAREQAQKSFLALFDPEEVGGASKLERFAIAAFVAGLHRESVATEFYRSLLYATAPDIVAVVKREIDRGQARGPYGAFPAGPLSREDAPGPIFSVSDAGRAQLGVRLTIALAHAHFLVFHPRDASPVHLQALLDAGWSTTGVVTLSQLVAFLSFQLRVIVGLRQLAATPARQAAA